MAKHTVVAMPGDGIGNQVLPEAVRVLKAVGFDAEYIHADIGWDCWCREGNALPQRTVDLLAKHQLGLFGAITSKPKKQAEAELTPDLRGKGYSYFSPIVTMRQRFNLDTCIRPCISFPGNPLNFIRKRVDGGFDEPFVNVVVFRQNTEGLYAGVGGFFKKGTADEIATQEDVNTRKGVERIIRYAFDLARRQNRRRVCMSDKSNALAYGHDLWQRVFKEIRNEYPEIEASHMYIDNLLMQMVRSPDQFEVIVTCNLFGDLASDVGAGLIGGLGLAPSGNIHPGRVSLFEPVHGSAPAIAGKNIANPMGAVLAAAMMFENFGWTAESQAIEFAVRLAIEEGKTAEIVLTIDDASKTP